MRLVAQHKDTTQLAQQIHHVLNFCHWAITTGSSTALLYSKRLVCSPSVNSNLLSDERS